MRLLILGGTSEASALGRLLADDPRFAPVLSLAGRTVAPVPSPIPRRIGGFGGADGLAAWLGAERIAAVVDATHPFARRMPHNARAAAQRTNIPILRIERPAWTPQRGDWWTIVDSLQETANALGTVPRRVFLTIGRLELAPFLAAPWHRYLIRSVDPIDALPPGAEAIAARGPFALDDEIELLASRRIEVLVTKNAGGAATRAKLDAARSLGLEVVMVARPLRRRARRSAMPRRPMPGCWRVMRRCAACRARCRRRRARSAASPPSRRAPACACRRAPDRRSRDR